DDRRDRHFPATDREPGLETEPAMDLVECEEVLAVAASERALRHRGGVRWSGWWAASACGVSTSGSRSSASGATGAAGRDRSSGSRPSPTASAAVTKPSNNGC